MAQLSFAIGNNHVSAPDGWTLVSQSDDKLILSSSRQQQATISLTRFKEDPTFDQFKTVCDIHLRAVKRALPAAHVEQDSLFSDRGIFGMCFFGDEKDCGRIFFGYVSLAQRELVSMFIEGVGIDPQIHGEDFQFFARGLKRP